MIHQKNIRWGIYFYMISGTFLIAFGVQIFFLPFNIVSGGMNGVSVLLYRLFDISPEITLFIANFPLLLLNFIFLGKKSTIATVFCAFLLPFFVKIVSIIPSYHGDVFLASLFGGIVTGVGIGLVFKGGSSTGGTAIVELIIHNYFKIPLGRAVILVDGLVLLTSFIFFDVTTGLYSMISLFIIGKAVDYVQTGGSKAKTLFIISQNVDNLVNKLNRDYDVGITKVASKGAYFDKESTLLICTCKEEKIIAVKQMTYEMDKKAFCIVVDVKEVIGNRW